MSDTTELELIKRAQIGDKKALNNLCKMHIGFVKQTASKYSVKGLDYDDITQLCFDGLLKAIDDYDLESNIHLISYARYKMMGIVSRKAGEISKLKRYGKECNVDDMFYLSVEHDFYSEDCFVTLEKLIETSGISETKKKVMRKLSENVKYGLGPIGGFRAIADDLGLSHQRVQQIIKEMKSNHSFKKFYKQLKEMVEA